jgi:formate-dependent nitrite reductase membrane component NrfD
MNENRERNESFHERRKQADGVIKAASVLSFISWAIAITAVLLIEIASPGRLNFQIGSRISSGYSTWNEPILSIAFVLLVLAMCSCIAAFVFNMMRMRRKADKFKKSIIIVGIITMITLVIFTFLMF